MKKICRDVKTQKGREQGWEGNIGPKIKQTTSYNPTRVVFEYLHHYKVKYKELYYVGFFYFSCFHCFFSWMMWIFFWNYWCKLYIIRNHTIINALKFAIIEGQSLVLNYMDYFLNWLLFSFFLYFIYNTVCSPTRSSVSHCVNYSVIQCLS